MATDRDIVSFDADGLKPDIDRFQTREGYDNRTDACRELIRVGLRETRSPIMYRLKNEVINWAGWLGVTAIIVVISGLTTPVLHPIHALMVAGIMCLVALSMLAFVELLRLYQGNSDLDRVLQEVAR